MGQLLVKCTHGTDVEMYLKGEYIDKNTKKKIILLDNFKVATERQLASHERVFKFKFSKHTTEFAFNWEDKDTDKAEFARCLKQHPHIRHDENKNISGATYFSLIDTSTQDEVQFKKDSAKVEVYNSLIDMDLQGLMEVAFFILKNPSGFTTLQLFNKLCGLNDGWLMENPAAFLAEYNLKDAKKKTIIRKAIVLGLIESQAGNFYIDKRPIGSFDSVVVYLNDNDKYYEMLSKEVAKKEILPAGAVENIKVIDALNQEKPKERKDTKLSNETKAENKEIRDEASRQANDRKEIQKRRLKDLGVSGWQASGAWTEETRLEKIKAAESTKKVEDPSLVPAADE